LVEVWLTDTDVGVRVRMMVLCDANIITEYDRRRPGLSSAPLDIEYVEYDNSTKGWIYLPLTLHTQHNPYTD